MEAEKKGEYQGCVLGCGALILGSLGALALLALAGAAFGVISWSCLAAYRVLEHFF